MNITFNKNIAQWLFVGISFMLVSLILFNTNTFFQRFKEEERIKMQTWALAQKDVRKNLNNTDLNEVTSHVITNTINHVQVLVFDKNNQLTDYLNIDDHRVNSIEKLNKLKEKFEKKNNPIITKYQGKTIQSIYYGTSPLINKLIYYPLALILILLLFASLIYFYFKSNKIAENNKLWTGMAKETAHQIATPLSSLVGWTEILKNEKVNPEYIFEIEKDIIRLQIITERFSKIGSLPELAPRDIVELVDSNIEYLKSRISKQVVFQIKLPNQKILGNINSQLFSWALENVIKNGIDAMKGKGNMTLKLWEENNKIKLSIKDSGKGMNKSRFKRVFEPGFTTKKRGWGLGLSLTKRIIEDYHGGKIFVLNSELNKGTEFMIILNLHPTTS